MTMPLGLGLCIYLPYLYSIFTGLLCLEFYGVYKKILRIIYFSCIFRCFRCFIWLVVFICLIMLSPSDFLECKENSPSISKNQEFLLESVKYVYEYIIYSSLDLMNEACQIIFVH